MEVTVSTKKYGRDVFPSHYRPSGRVTLRVTFSRADETEPREGWERRLGVGVVPPLPLLSSQFLGYDEENY